MKSFIRFVSVITIVSSLLSGALPANYVKAESALSNQTIEFTPEARTSSLIRSEIDADYPYQLEAQTGSIRNNQYGPSRNDPTEGIPEHAYSPFDDLDQSTTNCPPGGCDFMAGQVLVKLETSPVIFDFTQDNHGITENSLTAGLSEAGIIKLKPLFPTAEKPLLNETIETPDGNAVSKPDLTQWYLANIEEQQDVFGTIDELNTIDGVIWAEPNFIRKPVGKFSDVKSSTSALSDNTSLALPGPTTDPLYTQQWHLGATHVPEAWAYLESQGLPPGGNRDIIVAVIDTGVDYTHPDLSANIWVNPEEFNGVPGVDDDQNGYVDDIHGVDTVTPDGNPQDDHGHGTHVAGIIAAQANNGIGGVGVAYNVQIMPIKSAQYSGVLSAADIAEGIYYAIENGADVINMSFGGYARSQVEEDALAVAFGQAVLVAAAGNDSNANDNCNPFGPPAPMYPANYNWILGVMASDVSNRKAWFTNYDCYPRDINEYELIAPGIDIWSTLPNNQYAAWDGTSMSAPIISGIAALIRTKWADKEVYSSRFIMGQIAANATPMTNAYTSLTVAPQPDLKYLEHWLFDKTSQSPENDDDGTIDSGETIDLAIVIRNHWGKADPVIATLEPWAEGAFQPDPYVTMINDSVNYGAIGAFSGDDNGLIYDANDEVVGVQNPFRFSLSTETPNNHVIPMRLTITAYNGFDPADPNAPYTFITRFYLIVKRGLSLPSVISNNMTLTKDDYWLLTNPVLIESGATVTVTEGTQIEFWSNGQYDSIGNINQSYIQVEGNLIIQGNANSPVELFPSSLSPTGPVDIRVIGNGNVEIYYTRILNPLFGKENSPSINIVDHCYITQNVFNFISNPLHPTWSSLPSMYADTVSNSIFYKIGYFDKNGYERAFYLEQSPHMISNLYDSSVMILHETNQSIQMENNVFLKNYKQNGWKSRLEGIGYSCLDCDPIIGQTANPITNNAFLYVLWDTPNWMQIKAPTKRDYTTYITNNYWNATSNNLIESLLYDYLDDWNLARFSYEPYLTVAPETAYPFVEDVILSTDTEPDATIVGAESVTVTVTFNRDMDTNIQPLVSFGPADPMTDYTIKPLEAGWQNSRTWMGTFNVTPTTGDGYQLIRVAGAVAADDPWLVTGNDAGRFRFEIITSGTESMNLQATGGEGHVELSWTQDDFDLLSGFNLYRSTSQDGTYTRINSAIIPPDIRSYLDTDVTPGQPYFYKFTVVKSDITESDFSNIAQATPLDTIPPTLIHTPITSAAPGLPLTFDAQATDNVAVSGVTLYYRHQGESTYLTRPMVHTTGNNYFTTIEGSMLSSPGIEYYIEVTDGISITRNGRAEAPNFIAVDDRPVVTIVTPNRGPATGGTTVTIMGSNFKTGATVNFGGSAAANVTVVNSNQITCNAPEHYPSIVDVQVHNPDAQFGVLLNAYTFESTSALISLPETGGGNGNEVTIPINAANIHGLVADSLTVTYDPLVLRALSASTGSLTPGWTLASNLTIPGQVRLSMISPGGGVDGSGVLANIEFEVIGDPGSSSALTLSNILFNDGAIPVEATNGIFNVDNVYDVSGTINFWNGGAGIPSVLLSLTGDRIYSTTSGANGTFIIQGAAIDDYMLTASKSDGDNGIGAYDASLVLQHDVGLITLTGYAATAGDVNQSGAITSMDAYYILQKAVNLIGLPFPGSGKAWVFNPSQRSISILNSDLPGQDFTAVLLGDVSGNGAQLKTDSLVKNNFSNSPAAALSIQSGSVLPDQTIDIPVNLSINEANLYSADLTLLYDSTNIAITQVSLGSLASGWSIASNLSTPGVAQVAIAGATSISSNGELVKLTISAIGDPGSETEIVLGRGDLNEGAIPSSLNSGIVRIAIPVAADFTAIPTAGFAPLLVSFSNLSTGDWTTSNWDFGDGYTSSSLNPSHQYLNAGQYTVSLTVSGPGGSNIKTITNYIDVSTLQITGHIGYWAGGRDVANVTCTLDGDNDYSATSNSTGNYLLDGILTGNYLLTPTKNDGVDGITAFDASLVLQHSAGLITLTDNQAISADVNQSGTISALDASYILQKSVGLLPAGYPGVENMWVFNPSYREYANLSANQSDQDFTAILLGDPSGNWLGSGSQSSPNSPKSSAILTIQASKPDSNGIVTASISIDPNTTTIYGLNLQLIYDTSHANVIDINPGNLDGWQLAYNINDDGIIRLGTADTVAVPGVGQVAVIRLQLNDVMRVSRLEPVTGLVNEGDVPITMTGADLGGGTRIFIPIIMR